MSLFVNRAYDSVAGTFVRWESASPDNVGSLYPGPGVFGVTALDYVVECSLASSNGIANFQNDFITGETVTGTDSVLTGTLSYIPSDGESVLIIYDRQTLTQGLDFTISGVNITWLAGSGTAPDLVPGDTLFIYYVTESSSISIDFINDNITGETITGVDSALSATLSSTPSDAESVLCAYNRQILTQGQDFNVVGTTILWLANSGTAPDLVPSDTLQFYYVINTTSAGGGGAADALATTGADVNVSAAAPPTVGQVLKATSATTATWQNDDTGGASAFTDLTDTPANLTGASLQAVRVNVGETALEFYTPTSGAGGFLNITNIGVQGAGTVVDQVYADPPNNTIIESATTTEDTIVLSIESSTPNITVGATPATLPKVGFVYSGDVNYTVASPGPTVVAVTAGSVSASVTVTVDTPPQILTLSFAAQGGGAGGAATYPGTQTELKAGDQVRVEGTTDKSGDALVVSDLDAGTSEVVTYAAGTSFSVLITIADRGTSVQNLAATVASRDTDTAAVGPTRATNFGGGSTDGVDTVKLNNIYPSVSLGTITYPLGQGGLKAVEVATVVNTLSDFDTVLYDDPTGTELTIANTSTSETPKSVTRVGGTYNVSTPNFRISATRTANAAVTVQQTTVAIANVAATLSVSLPTTRLRSGGNDGTSAQDHTITISADQQLFSSPTLAPQAGAGHGTFQGGGFTGGPTLWTRDLRVDETIPDLKGTFTWASISGTNLAGIVTSSFTGSSQYTLGGFVARTLNFTPFNPLSAETVVVSDETKLASASFSNGNPGVRQPFGTADTSDAGKEGWYAPTASSGSVNIRMLHAPSVAANSLGLTLAALEETV